MHVRSSADEIRRRFCLYLSFGSAEKGPVGNFEIRILSQVAEIEMRQLMNQCSELHVWIVFGIDADAITWPFPEIIRLTLCRQTIGGDVASMAVSILNSLDVDA